MLLGVSLPVEVVCAAVAAVGVVASALISWFITRSSIAKELEKMHMEWEREDIVSSDDEFAEMASAVASFIQCQSSTYHIAAAQKVAAIRSKESGTIAHRLDHLYVLIDHRGGAQKSELNQALTEVIDEKRKARTGSQNSNTKKPK